MIGKNKSIITDLYNFKIEQANRVSPVKFIRSLNIIEY